MRYEIEIEITSDGEVKAVVKGVKGHQCGPLSAFLNDLGDVTYDSDTPEALQQETQAIGTRQAIGARRP